MSIRHKNRHSAPLKPFNFRTAALSTGGLGFVRPAPGTWGSTPPVLLLIGLGLLGAGKTVLLIAAAVFLALFSFSCVLLGDYAEQRFGLKDAPEVVADETAGVCIPAITAILLGDANALWVNLILAFLFFRLFDIWKPWPVHSLEKLRGGWGVLMDDIAAGFYAALAVAAITRL